MVNFKRFKLMHASEFPDGKLRSGRAFTPDGFEAGIRRLKDRFSSHTDASKKSGAAAKGKGSRLFLSENILTLMESIWSKDPAIVVNVNQLASFSGGMGSDEVTKKVT